MHSTFPNISFNFDDKSNYRSKYNLTDQCLRKQHPNIYPPKKDSMNKVTQTRKKKYQSTNLSEENLIKNKEEVEARRKDLKRAESEGFCQGFAARSPTTPRIRGNFYGRT